MPLGVVGEPGSTMAPRGAIPARCMDQAAPRTSTVAPLAAFVEELRRTERFQELVRTLPTRARVSEPVLPLVLAALHAELGRALLVLLPEDAEARDAADGASWFGDAARVAFLPSSCLLYTSDAADD